MEVDVAVFGSGAGGMAAALVAANEGLRVALFEKTGLIGGTTAKSGGAIWVPGTDAAVVEEVDDEMENVVRYLRGELGDHYRSDLIEAFLSAGPEAIRYFEHHSEVKFDLMFFPDYHSDNPGGTKYGRCLSPQPFDGRRLGKDFSLLRPPFSSLVIFGGMTVLQEQAPAFLRPFSSLRNFRTVVRAVLRYGKDRLSFPRGTSLGWGNALAARLFFSVRSKGVAVLTESPLLEIIEEDGRVAGAIYEHKGMKRKVNSRLGVVVATGGFPASAVKRLKLARDFPHDHTVACEGNVGDGLSAACDIGAALDADLAGPGFWTPASVFKPGEADEEVYPYGHLDRGKPGAIAITADGKRFANESDSYHDITMAMFASPAWKADPRAYLLCGSDFIRRYGFGCIRPMTRSFGKYIKAGYLVKGDTLDELASKLDVSAEGLKETVATHNGYVATGVDLEFHKGETAFNRFHGDRSCKPNPNLRAIEPPFYATRVYPGTIGTTLGLKTNADAQVLDEDGREIAGLYACGNDMSSVMRGYYPGPGISIGPGLVFGFRAAMHMRMVSDLFDRVHPGDRNSDDPEVVEA